MSTNESNTPGAATPDAEPQDETSKRVEEYRANPGDRRCFLRHPEDASAQCVLGAGHSGTHVFERNGAYEESL